MKLLERMIDVALLTRPMWGAALSRRALSKAVNLVILGVIAGVLSCMLLIGLFYAIYRVALLAGLSSDGALMVMAAFVVLALWICLARISRTLSGLREGMKSPVAHLGDIADAFFNGLKEPTPDDADQPPR